MSPATRRFGCGSRLLGLVGLVVIMAITTLASTPALAWHDDGHRIVGEIAERHLSPAARARVSELLADLPDYDTLATAATWADQRAKLDPTYDFVFASHYVNIEAPQTPRDLLSRCLQTNGCVALGVAYYADVLRSARASEAQRGEALRFLAHFVGDAHQPLHAGHAGDRGGNDVSALALLEYTPGRERTNLHAVWDGGLIAITMTRAGWDWRRYASELDRRITPEQIARWGRGSVGDWLEESWLLAAGDAYLQTDGRTPIHTGDALGEDYYASNSPIVELRLQQAGIRLALVLEDIFGEGSTPVGPPTVAPQ